MAKNKFTAHEMNVVLDESCGCHLPCDGCKMADESKFDCSVKGYRALIARTRKEVKDGE